MTTIKNGSIWVHKQTKSEYSIICEAKDEATSAKLVVYQSFHDGQIWVRPRSMFVNKFDPLHPTTETTDDE